MIGTSQFRPCDVHRLLDYDVTPRDCWHCSLCDAWICTECSGNWPRRIKAAIKRKLEPGYSGHPHYEELVNHE